MTCWQSNVKCMQICWNGKCASMRTWCGSWCRCNISGCDALQVRARTSAGYGAFSRRFEFQTSPYCEYARQRVKYSDHDGRIKFNLLKTTSTTGLFLSKHTFCFFDSNSHQWASSGLDSGGGHHAGSGPPGSSCWIPAQWTVRLKYTAGET